MNEYGKKWAEGCINEFLGNHIVFTNLKLLGIDDNGVAIFEFYISNISKLKYEFHLIDFKGEELNYKQIIINLYYMIHDYYSILKSVVDGVDEDLKQMLIDLRVLDSFK